MLLKSGLKQKNQYSAWGEGDDIFEYYGGATFNGAMAELLSNMVFLVTESILLTFAYRYLKTEQAEGTPFTENGAAQLRRLSIRFIYMPIVAIVIVAVITVFLGVERSGDISNLLSVGTGIVLIMASLIFRYGAELERGDQARITDGG